MPQYVVRYGALRHLGVFSTSRNESYQRGMAVVVRTKRGLDLGDLLCEATERAVQDLTDSTGGQILREVRADDRREMSRIRNQERKVWEYCLQKVKELEVPMKPVDVEYVF
ncbi:MAG: signal peptidase, partial [Planctomycetales bacterium]|nr:signal peptidase [Planctomycetales bacterium]NIP71431.1 signal peptidase [Planctomycetales bacterium]